MSNESTPAQTQQTNLEGIEALTRLALKCQAQSRCSAAAIAEIQIPTSFIRQQTNIAHGNQQVNNAIPEQYAQARTPAPENISLPSKLLEKPDDQGLDTRTTSQAGRADQLLVPVGKINRPSQR